MVPIQFDKSKISKITKYYQYCIIIPVWLTNKMLLMIYCIRNDNLFDHQDFIERAKIVMNSIDLGHYF